MSKIVLIGSDCTEKAQYLETCEMPSFYMEDFTILGFTVSKIEMARDILKKAGFTLIDKICASEITVNNPKQILSIRDHLLNAGMSVELSDIADTMYQA